MATDTNRSTLRDLLAMIPAAGRGLTTATAAAVIGQGIVPIALMVDTGELVGRTPEFLSRSGHPRSWLVLTVLLGLVGVLLAAEQFLGLLLAGLSERLGRRLNLTLRARLMTIMLRPVGLSHLDDPRVQDLRAVAQGLRGGYAGVMGSVVGLANNAVIVLVGCGSAIAVGLASPALGGAVLALDLAVGWLIRRRFRDTVSPLRFDPSGQRRAAYFRDLAVLSGPEKELRIFGLGGWTLRQFHETWATVMRMTWQERRRSGWPLIALFVGLGVCYSAAAFWLARSGADGTISISRMAIAIQGILGMMPLAMVSQWDEMMQGGRDAALAVLKLEALVGTGPRPDPPARGDSPARTRPRIVTVVGERARPDIAVEDVHFGYPNGGGPVLNGLSLVIPTGRSCAIVGRNGSGKSTLLKLILRFYDPSVGRITVGGVPLPDLDPTSWRSQCAVVFQDFLRLGLTMREAIEYGAWHQRGGQEALDLAVRRAGIAPLIEQLPHGWDTRLSPQLTGGTDLSGGQWQKVAIARALYAIDRGAQLLVMDEPTASLDAEAERVVYESILDASVGCTSILVSHRFASVRKADHIYVLDKGVIAEQGDHSSLMAGGGLYAAMFGKQAMMLR